jgi:NAD(P)-dependent dehydrogenase (short-subunit alcohol dehydrogenase family)
MQLAGARILVSGGAHRVGRAVALHLAHAGAHVGISYFSSETAAHRTRDDIAALGVSTSVMRANAAVPADMIALIDGTAAALGGLDAYVHAPSGGFEPRAPERIDEELWSVAMDSTAKGFMFASQAAFRLMAPAGAGVIVAISDVAALQPWPAFAAHCAAKAAQAHLVKCLAAAWGRSGVRVCAVAPGPVLMPDHLPPESSRNAAEETALGRLGGPDDVAQAVRFCLEADYLTGQNVIVDGGRILSS